jgi:hypothetical protein
LVNVFGAATKAACGILLGSTAFPNTSMMTMLMMIMKMLMMMVMVMMN